MDAREHPQPERDWQSLILALNTGSDAEPTRVQTTQTDYR